MYVCVCMIFILCVFDFFFCLSFKHTRLCYCICVCVCVSLYVYLFASHIFVCECVHHVCVHIIYMFACVSVKKLDHIHKMLKKYPFFLLL